MKTIIQMSTVQHDHNFRNRIIETANDFNVKASVHFEKTTFMWPMNRNHFRIVAEGEQEQVDRFIQYINPEEKEESIAIPLAIICVFFLTLVALLLFVSL